MSQSGKRQPENRSPRHVQLAAVNSHFVKPKFAIPAQMRIDDRDRRMHRCPKGRDQHFVRPVIRHRIRLHAAPQQVARRFPFGPTPDDVPSQRDQLPWQLVALGRYIIWGWPEGEAAGDLLRGGVQPDPVAYHGSNEMLIAPFRTAMHAPIAVIDPHLSWYGEFRFYEMRIYGGELNMSGAAILGLPFPTLGHNRFLSVAMTTGGPDTSDAFIEDVKDGKYRFKDEWRPLDVRTERIGVKDGNETKWQDIKIESTHHGPIVAHKDGKSYAMAIPYANEYLLMDSAWKMAVSHNLAEAKKALSGLQYMAQNIMVGTVDGDIYYVRNGRVPIRPKGCDSSKPMLGYTGDCEWQGIHAFEDLVQVTNPSQGYMQNCNVSPYSMMKDSPMIPEKYAEHPYLYNEGSYRTHQRAQMMVDLLDAARNVTAEQAIGIAFSPQVWHAELWQARIRKAAPESEFAKLLADWNRRSDSDSRGALGYYLFKMALGNGARAVDPPDSLTDDEVRTALAKAEQRLKTEFAADATYGTLFRVGRQGGAHTYPASGGSVAEAGMAVPRAIGFKKTGTEMMGQSGQTSTQIVILTKPPQSYMVIPMGESDHPESGHFDDQAEKLFSKSQAKSTYFLNRKELEKHVSSKLVLDWPN